HPDLMLQDLSDTPTNRITMFGNPVNELHRDLCLKEKEFRSGLPADWKKYQKAINAYTESLSPLINFLWHSEARLLHFLNKNLKPFHIDISRNIFCISLHIHSTQNCCDCCRSQIVGSLYQWLYDRLLMLVRNEDLIIHTVVSWIRPYDKTTFTHESPVKDISVDCMATREYISPSPYTFSSEKADDGKYFASFVQLDEPTIDSTTAAS
ncbi:MAG: hypothetical protein Q8K36_00255, partial [Alphaproteobacteria bacterium]|nr:hypothetical protein [Alphaproteobacteria bacterium]